MTVKNRFRTTLQKHAWPTREQREESEQPGAEACRVQIVEARRGGEHVTVEIFTAASYAEARRLAERTQELADAQVLPRRAYVLDRFGVPVFAAAMTEAGRAQVHAAIERMRNPRRP